ncbi:MAG TPA: STAS domain-containing protein [Novosphingobium sp.]|nr:STAS domain-containing protein [Novosphingobium sp.]HZV11413.1 STAS domain-containing protein [Novosphingobium sp.]
MSFEAQLNVEHAINWLSLSGRLDSATANDLEQVLLPLFAAPAPTVLVDFAGLGYISSAGLRVVLMAAKRAKQAGGRLMLCGLSSAVREVFEISGFLKILEVSDSRAEAERLLLA